VLSGLAFLVASAVRSMRCRNLSEVQSSSYSYPGRPRRFVEDSSHFPLPSGAAIRAPPPRRARYSFFAISYCTCYSQRHRSHLAREALFEYRNRAALRLPANAHPTLCLSHRGRLGIRVSPVRSERPHDIRATALATIRVLRYYSIVDALPKSPRRRNGARISGSAVRRLRALSSFRMNACMPLFSRANRRSWFGQSLGLNKSMHNRSTWCARAAM